MIEIWHLVKKYGDHYAVKDLNVRIEEGQIYGFLGPNGAGKGKGTYRLSAGNSAAVQ